MLLFCSGLPIFIYHRFKRRTALVTEYQMIALAETVTTMVAFTPQLNGTNSATKDPGSNNTHQPIISLKSAWPVLE